MPSGVYKRKPLTEEHKKNIGRGRLGITTLAKGTSWSKARREVQKPRKPIIKNNKEYSFDWHEIRKKIYRRDNWTCQDCSCKCNGQTKTKIQCHHIDYNEKNNKDSNLITLCNSCHCKTNFRRSDWINYFKGKCKPLIALGSLPLS